MKQIGKLISLALAGVLSAGMMTACGSSDEDVFTIAYAPNESTEQSADARNEIGRAHV